MVQDRPARGRLNLYSLVSSYRQVDSAPIKGLQGTAIVSQRPHLGLALVNVIATPCCALRPTEHRTPTGKDTGSWREGVRRQGHALGSTSPRPCSHKLLASHCLHPPALQRDR